MSALRIPYALAVYDDEEIAAVLDVLRDPAHIVPGKRVQQFERQVAKLFGKPYGVMVNSGSAANLLALELLDLPQGSEIITPILTFATTVAPIVQKSCIPVFVDVEEGTYQINCDLIEAAITSNTKALLIPSLVGNIPDYKRIREIADRHGLIVIEDSCDTLGSSLDGVPTGTFTHISTTSFYASHIITAAGGGGMLAVHEVNFRDKARVLRGWGRSSALFAESEDLEQRFSSTIDGVPYDGKFIFSAIGYNMQPIELQAAFALEQLKKLPTFATLRKRHFSRLSEFFLTYHDFFILPRQRDGVETNWLAFPLVVRREAPFTRIELARYLEQHNVQTRPVFTGNILKQPGFQHITHRSPTSDFPVADDIMRGSIMVGCHHGLTDVHIDYLQSVIINFINVHR